MSAYVDLEVVLHRRNVDYYETQLRISLPDSNVDISPPHNGPQLVQLDLERLRSLEGLDADYGRELSKRLFMDERVHQAFVSARTAAQSHNQALRFRLVIGPSAPELHSLHWEKLLDPDKDSSLVANEQILFSRYLSSFDWRPVCLRPQADLSALVVIANPDDITKFQPGGRILPPLTLANELAQAKAFLGDIPVKELLSRGQATLKNLCANLRDVYDILYLVCHGALIEGEPRIWLEDDQGKAAIVSGQEIVENLSNLPQRPLLVVLASCQSAGDGTGGVRGAAGALAGLGPRLAEAGIPAVLAMQSDVSEETVSKFMPVFFQEMKRDGEIDRAMAAARGAVRNQLDWWVPVLFMRLKSGQLWYAPGFAEDKKPLEIWPALVMQIEAGKCTAVLGPGLNEAVLGSPREIAKRWAMTYNFPMSPHHRDDLPQVAQFLATKQAHSFPALALEKLLRTEIANRFFEGTLPDELQKAPFTRVLSAVGERLRASNPSEPHAVLASLPFRIYLTATPDNLLTEALRVKKDPQVAICPWNEVLVKMPSVFRENPSYEPTESQPLVYHLFGRFKETPKEPDSLVLTEDDYFDYLIGVTKNIDLIPNEIQRVMADSALLFLGFNIEDWDFRVLFRSLMNMEGSTRRPQYANVAVQIDPEAGRLMNPEMARRYLEKYFDEAKISIYWGRSEDFIRDLQKQFSGGAS